jgi:hypothetical protein
MEHRENRHHPQGLAYRYPHRPQEKSFRHLLVELFPHRMVELFPHRLVELFPHPWEELFPHPLEELFPHLRDQFRCLRAKSLHQQQSLYLGQDRPRRHTQQMLP